MAKALRDEDLRLNIIINGDAGRKSIEDLKRIPENCVLNTYAQPPKAIVLPYCCLNRNFN